MSSNIPPTVPTIFLSNNQPRTLSTDVARFFSKRHDNVLRQIEKTMANCPKSFSALNFEVAEYTDEQGKIRPAYSMTKDGFTVLAMGFTGSKAMQFKLAYIEAFNAMHAELVAKDKEAFRLTGGDRLPDVKSTTSDRKPLKDLIAVWVSVAPLAHSQAWKQVKAQFGVQDVNDLTIAQIQEACQWVQNHIDSIQSAVSTAIAAHQANSYLPIIPEPIITESTLRRAGLDGAALVVSLKNAHKYIDGFFNDNLDIQRKLKKLNGDKTAIKRFCYLIDSFTPYAATLNMSCLLAESLVQQTLAGYEIIYSMQSQKA